MPLQKVNAARRARQQSLVARQQMLRQAIRALQEHQRRRSIDERAPGTITRSGGR